MQIIQAHKKLLIVEVDEDLLPLPDWVEHHLAFKNLPLASSANNLGPHQFPSTTQEVKQCMSSTEVYGQGTMAECAEECWQLLNWVISPKV